MKIIKVKVVDKDNKKNTIGKARLVTKKIKANPKRVRYTA